MVNMQENLYLRRGAENRAHIPPMPMWLGIIRVIQFVFTLLVLILSAYSSSVFGAGYFIGYGLSFYIFFWTILFLAYIIAAPLFFPNIYVYWVHLILEFKTTVFWLATFALLATEASAWGILDNYFNEINGAIGATKAAAAFGAFTWALFVASLIVTAIACFKHHKAKKPMFYNSAPAPVGAADAEKGAPVAPVHQQPVELNEYQPAPVHHQ